MANSERCRYCGYYESEHDHLHMVDDPEEILKGFELPITRCRGFVSVVKHDKPATPTPHDDFMDEVLERRARERAAWGAFVTYGRNEQLKVELRAFDKRIRDTYSEKERQEIRDEKEAYIRMCQSLPSIYIG